MFCCCSCWEKCVATVATEKSNANIVAEKIICCYRCWEKEKVAAAVAEESDFVPVTVKKEHVIDVARKIKFFALATGSHYFSVVATDKKTLLL